MMVLYASDTPNGRKPLILLEELGLAYEVRRVDLGAGEQRRPEFLAMNPNGRIPVLVDGDLPVWESGAILVHLAEKTGRFLPTSPRPRAAVLQWLFFQMSAVGPMMGQAWHFRFSAPEEIPYARTRYLDETKRILGVLDVELGQRAFLGADEPTIADVATWPWVRAAPLLGLPLSDWPHVDRWVQALDARPAVRRAMAVPL